MPTFTAILFALLFTLVFIAVPAIIRVLRSGPKKTTPRDMTVLSIVVFLLGVISVPLHLHTGGFENGWLGIALGIVGFLLRNVGCKK